MLVFEERGKPEYPEKNLSEQRREPTTNSTHILRRVRESIPSHIGGRRVLWPLRHSCSLMRIKTFFIRNEVSLLDRITLRIGLNSYLPTQLLWKSSIPQLSISPHSVLSSSLRPSKFIAFQFPSWKKNRGHNQFLNKIPQNQKETFNSSERLFSPSIVSLSWPIRYYDMKSIYQTESTGARGN